MQKLVVLFALLALSSASVWKGGLRIRFDIGFNIGGSFFYNVPRTVTDAISEGWTLETPPPGLALTSVVLYCYSDRVVCLFYDEDGDVAGLQVGLPQNNFTPYDDMEKTGFTQWTVDGASYWTLQQYFTTEELLSSRRMLRANENQIIENGGVWVVGIDKQLTQIANTTDELVNSELFTKQACIPWMGRHYYYKMTTTTSCTDEPLFPWFPIVESGELIATGFLVPGTLNLDSNARNWFEAPGRSEVEMIVPDAPECMYQIAASPGFVTMHIYYVNEPWLVSCLFQ